MKQGYSGACVYVCAYVIVYTETVGSYVHWAVGGHYMERLGDSFF